jgi:hypothetical protein
VLQLHAGGVHEELHAEVAGGPVPRRAEEECFSRRQRHELAHVARGKVAAHDQQHRHVGDHAHRGERGCRIERHLRVQELVDREDPRGAHEERVAVGLRARHEVGAYVSARAGPVLDHDRLAELLLQPLAHRPRKDVGEAAGRERRDDLHRPRRIRLRRELRRQRKAEQRECESRHSRVPSSCRDATL